MGSRGSLASGGSAAPPLSGNGARPACGCERPPARSADRPNMMWSQTPHRAAAACATSGKAETSGLARDRSCTLSDCSRRADPSATSSSFVARRAYSCGCPRQALWRPVRLRRQSRRRHGKRRSRLAACNDKRGPNSQRRVRLTTRANGQRPTLGYAYRGPDEGGRRDPLRLSCSKRRLPILDQRETANPS